MQKIYSEVEFQKENMEITKHIRSKNTAPSSNMGSTSQRFKRSFYTEAPDPGTYYNDPITKKLNYSGCT